MPRHDHLDAPIGITAVGACTAVGRDAWSSAAAARAGISGFSLHPYMFDTAGDLMQAAIAPWIDIEVRGSARLEALLWPAIDQVLAPIDGVVGAEAVKVALSLGLPAARPGQPTDLPSAVVGAARARYAPQLAAVASFPRGHAAGLLALQAACTKLRQGSFDACVVAGVDSYIEPETLEWLEDTDQVHGAGVQNNAWGFVPGEAAGALLIARQDTIDRLGLPCLALVLGVGTAIESCRIRTDTVCIGEGLTAAFRDALAAASDGGKVTDVYCDMNGDTYRADEYGFACLRTGQAFTTTSDFVAPAECWGDVGAASGPLLMAISAIAGVKGYANGPRALAWTSSDGGERAAALLHIRESR